MTQKLANQKALSSPFIHIALCILEDEKGLSEIIFVAQGTDIYYLALHFLV